MTGWGCGLQWVRKYTAPSGCRWEITLVWDLITMGLVGCLGIILRTLSMFGSHGTSTVLPAAAEGA
jgi:hypothetical protein